MDVDAMFAKVREQRFAANEEAGQLTLGRLVRELERAPGSREVVGLCGEPHSYRGYYEDLAIDPGVGKRATVEGLLDLLYRCTMGRTFVGWKGGDYVMHEHSWVWVAKRGCTGERLVGLHERTDGRLVAVTEPEEVRL